MVRILALFLLGLAGWVLGYSAVILIYHHHYLPHRPTWDIQGHQDEAPQHPCPAVYDAPTGELNLCWGAP